MADESLKAPLASNQQNIRREMLPKEWSAALVLDYLDKSEYGDELSQRVLQTGQATYQLQVTVEELVIDVSEIADNLTYHVLQTSTHGATGNIIGSGDFAQESTTGVAYKALAVADAVASSVAITSPDAAAAPATYSQSQIQGIVDLVNELKSALAQLVSDHNGAVSTVNSSLQTERDAQQRTT